MERRTVAGETGESALAEVQSVLDGLRRQDAEVDATARLLTFRGAYRLDPSHELATIAASALRRAGRSGVPIGMTRSAATAWRFASSMRTPSSRSIAMD